MEIEIHLFRNQRKYGCLHVRGLDKVQLFRRVRELLKENEAAGLEARVLVGDTPEMRQRRVALFDAIFEDESFRVREAFLHVPRHRYVPWEQLGAAYLDYPLDIGSGQSMTQPSLAVRMTAELNPIAGDRVLEVGTGSGYQAAVLSRLCGELYTVERLPILHSAAARLFEIENLSSIHLHLGDGSKGWSEAAPFDKIIQTAASDGIPKALLRQLKPGGRMVLPLSRRGSPAHPHELCLVEKDPNGSVKSTKLLDSRFVPLRFGVP